MPLSAKKKKRRRQGRLLWLLPVALVAVALILLARQLDGSPAVTPAPSASEPALSAAAPEPTAAPAPAESPGPTPEPTPVPTPEPTPDPTPEPEPTLMPEAVASLAEAALATPRRWSREEAVARLEELAEWDSRFLLLRDRADEFSDMVLTDAANNPELLEFLLDYPKKQTEFGEFTEAELRGEVPLLLQYDARWGYYPYGSSALAVTGCGPTCLSICALHFTGNPEATPDRMAQWCLDNDYYVYGAGTKWALFTTGAAAWGLEGKELGLWKQGMYSALDEGKWIVLIMDTGDFTVFGHFIVLCGYDENGFEVLDPFSVARTGVRWTYEQISGQISNLWAIRALPEEG